MGERFHYDPLPPLSSLVQIALGVDEMLTVAKEIVTINKQQTFSSLSLDKKLDIAIFADLFLYSLLSKYNYIVPSKE